MKMKAKEYSSYIKGLIDGTNLDKTTPEGKVISALAELCDQMAAEIETLRDELDVANEYIEELDEDLGAVEEVVYDVDDDCATDDDCDCVTVSTTMMTKTVAAADDADMTTKMTMTKNSTLLCARTAAERYISMIP